MTETSITLSVGIHSTPIEIWDALARVCEVQESNGIRWISFKTPAGADVHFYANRSTGGSAATEVSE